MTANGVVLMACLLAGVVLLMLGRQSMKPSGKQEAPVVMMDPKDLLFSLPTLADGLPQGVKVQAVPPGAFCLHEDDWRQVEFVGSTQVAAVEVELQELRTFMSQHRKGAGFSEVYVRRGRADGLMPLAIAAAALESLLPGAARRRPLVVGSAPWGPSRVNGYAVEIGPNAVLYVEVVGGHLATVGLPLAWRPGASSATNGIVATIGRTLGLRLIDWPSAAWVRLE